MTEERKADQVCDAGLLGCGELVLLLASRLKAMEPGSVLRLTSLDPGAMEDVPAWCRMTGHTLLRAEPPIYTIQRRKGN